MFNNLNLFIIVSHNLLVFPLFIKILKCEKMNKDKNRRKIKFKLFVALQYYAKPSPLIFISTKLLCRSMFWCKTDNETFF